MKKGSIEPSQYNIFGNLHGKFSSQPAPLDKLAQHWTFDKKNIKLIENQLQMPMFANAVPSVLKKVIQKDQKIIENNRRILERVKYQEDKKTALTEKLTFLRYGNKHDKKVLTNYKKQKAKVLERQATKRDLRNKIKNKLFSYEIAANLAAENPKSELYKSYLNTCDCQKEIVQDGKYLTSKYCNNRFCYSCNRIRTAKLINNYMPVFESFQNDIYMVTLTVPNCNAGELKTTVKEMVKVFQKIKDSGRKLYERKGSKNLLTGFRKIECTYNYEKKNFHPHFHIVVTSLSAAEYLKETWLKHFTNATENAQDIRPADLNSVKELFKYFTKFWESKKSRSNKKYKTDFKALDVIFCGIKGIRIFQTFGFTKLKIDESEEIDTIHKTAYNINFAESQISWRWDYESALNYIDLETGESLKEYYLNKKEVETMAVYIGFHDVSLLPVKKRLTMQLNE